MNQKETIRNRLLSLGADVCGFANISRFSDSPTGFNPIDIYSECKTVISFGVALPRGLSKIPPRLIYEHYNSFCIPEVDRIAFVGSKFIEHHYDCLAIPMPSDSPYEYWDEAHMEGKGLLSMKHIGVTAGLGIIGKSALLLNEKYGNLLTLGAILSNLELESDIIAKNICLEKCEKCIVNCPVGAIDSGTVNQKLCRSYTYGKNKRGFDIINCNNCRTVCPMCSGILKKKKKKTKSSTDYNKND